MLIVDYVNDGMYGSFNCLTFDHAVVQGLVMKRNGDFVLDQPETLALLPQFAASIWGPTCDSIDLIGKDLMLPELKIGDWLCFERMGAYTCSAASGATFGGEKGFNGFDKPRVHYTNTE